MGEFVINVDNLSYGNSLIIILLDLDENIVFVKNVLIKKEKSIKIQLKNIMKTIKKY